jgi:hypothetical protein
MHPGLQRGIEEPGHAVCRVHSQRGFHCDTRQRPVPAGVRPKSRQGQALCPPRGGQGARQFGPQVLKRPGISANHQGVEHVSHRTVGHRTRQVGDRGVVEYRAGRDAGSRCERDGEVTAPPAVSVGAQFGFPLPAARVDDLGQRSRSGRVGDRDEVLQILAAAVESAGSLVVQVTRTAIAAADAGVLTRAQRDVVLEAVIALEPRAIAAIDIAKAVTSEPELRATVAQLLAVFDPLVSMLASSGSTELARLGEALRLAYRVATVYMGGDR